MIREQFIAGISALVIVAGIFAVSALLSVRAYLKGLEQSRQRLAAYHADLEAKVAERTAELSRSTELARRERNRAETLLTDVNHRVGNNLALVSSFLTMQQRALTSPEAVAGLASPRAQAYLRWSRFPFVVVDRTQAPPRLRLNDYRYSDAGARLGWAGMTLEIGE